MHECVKSHGDFRWQLTRVGIPNDEILTDGGPRGAILQVFLLG